MRIGILNLPFDNNYGGNLQRYALVKTLQKMGHDVECVFLYPKYSLPIYKWPYSYTKRLIKKIVKGDNSPILLEQVKARNAKEMNSLALAFYNHYIPHTKLVKSLNELINETNEKYDAFVVGSDQVWREDMTRDIGIENYFFKFLKGSNTKRIAYAISLGTEKKYPSELVRKLTPLYSKFDFVSVREDTALNIIESYGWTNPDPQWVLDPTLLLTQDDYINLIKATETNSNTTKGKIFCYILDKNENKKGIINQISNSRGLSTYEVGLKDTAKVSIEQWLCNIKNSEMVITDSYHGIVFSIIFRRPFIFLPNEVRGNSRIESLFRQLGISENHLIWTEIHDKLKSWRKFSLDILSDSLKG